MAEAAGDADALDAELTSLREWADLGAAAARPPPRGEWWSRRADAREQRAFWARIGAWAAEGSAACGVARSQACAVYAPRKGGWQSARLLRVCLRTRVATLVSAMNDIGAARAAQRVLDGAVEERGRASYCALGSALVRHPFHLQEPT